MNILSTTIPDVLILEPKVFEDERGYFFESYKENFFKEKINDIQFIQDNVSRSSRNTIRGLHFQVGEFAQGKLCQVVFGTVLDVAVDLRKNSPTFGKHIAVELSDQKKNQIWIPPGFAHGFSVLSESAIFVYKCTNYYNKESERTLLYNDPALKIDWKISDPIVSAKDQQGTLLKDLIL
ncbi:MAG: dTDP-4-dehydrorhamnose 3,5-epimerase [Ignavibacteriales bacterium]|nr:dTDP-4-dehydrorhamnose 3,5-epimerase [Ignavibacteriales bacterium]